MAPVIPPKDQATTTVTGAPARSASAAAQSSAKDSAGGSVHADDDATRMPGPFRTTAFLLAACLHSVPPLIACLRP